ncbi:hypothetical protein C450_04923 [Halococcus salifodinae DSM 8989]|uniref:Uncharacterized protein n=1 Tax=Halococcus salifodinae DSM 8989 TaxID=1227456 RepID=M0NCE9_9EURY|nr:hypothetical protein C450_04923 [Halococcus salifodinae DSM 8989]
MLHKKLGELLRETLNVDCDLSRFELIRAPSEQGVGDDKNWRCESASELIGVAFLLLLLPVVLPQPASSASPAVVLAARNCRQFVEDWSVME